MYFWYFHFFLVDWNFLYLAHKYMKFYTVSKQNSTLYMWIRLHVYMEIFEKWAVDVHSHCTIVGYVASLSLTRAEEETDNRAEHNMGIWYACEQEIPLLVILNNNYAFDYEGFNMLLLAISWMELVKKDGKIWNLKHQVLTKSN